MCAATEADTSLVTSFTHSSVPPTVPPSSPQQQNLLAGFSSRPPVQNVQKSPLAFFRFTCFQPGRPPYSSLLISRAFCRSSRAHHQRKAAPAPSLGYQNSQKTPPRLHRDDQETSENTLMQVRMTSFITLHHPIHR